MVNAKIRSGGGSNIESKEFSSCEKGVGGREQEREINFLSIKRTEYREATVLQSAAFPDMQGRPKDVQLQQTWVF